MDHTDLRKDKRLGMWQGIGRGLESSPYPRKLPRGLPAA